MTNAYSLIEITENSLAKGLAPVTCYDPWFPRALESIKQAICDGHPVLIRLHSAASYPIQSKLKHEMDLESHAVLIIGFDDEKEAFLIIDPWNNDWGGTQGGQRWLSYQKTSTETVDSSLGFSMVIAPLEVNWTSSWIEGKGLSIELIMGFYTPKGTIMDRHSWSITQFDIFSSTTNSLDTTFQTVKGKWVVGQKAKCLLELGNSLQSNSRIQLQIIATIQGERPYHFTDTIEVMKTIQLISSRKTVSV